MLQDGRLFYLFACLSVIWNNWGLFPVSTGGVVARTSGLPSGRLPLVLHHQRGLAVLRLLLCHPFVLVRPLNFTFSIISFLFDMIYLDLLHFDLNFSYRYFLKAFFYNSILAYFPFFSKMESSHRVGDFGKKSSSKITNIYI